MRRVRLAATALLVAVLAGGGAGCSDCDLEVSTAARPDGLVGASYAANLGSRCGGGFWFIQAGTLPPGIGLQDDGDLRGTPTVDGIYPFTVGVIDYGSDEVAYKGLSIEVLEP
jgi:hypothetical protein